LQQQLQQETEAKMSAETELLSLAQSKVFQEQQLGETNAAKEQLQCQLHTSEAQNLQLSKNAAGLSTEQAALQQKLQQETEAKTSAERNCLL
jgi:hypothetical protein